MSMLNFFYMKEYLTVCLKYPATLLLDVTVHIELVVESVCMYQTQLLMTSVWHTQTLSVSYLYLGSINLFSLLFCSPEDFNDIISRSGAIILSISSPLPNIIMLGDFNFPDINWLNPDYNCSDDSPLISISDWLFLNQFRHLLVNLIY